MGEVVDAQVVVDAGWRLQLWQRRPHSRSVFGHTQTAAPPEKTYPTVNTEPPVPHPHPHPTLMPLTSVNPLTVKKGGMSENSSCYKHTECL